MIAANMLSLFITLSYILLVSINCIIYIENMNFYFNNKLWKSKRPKTIYRAPSPHPCEHSPPYTLDKRVCTVYTNPINYQRVPEITETIYINVSIGCIEYNISIEDGERMWTCIVLLFVTVVAVGEIHRVFGTMQLSSGKRP